MRDRCGRSAGEVAEIERHPKGRARQIAPDRVEAVAAEANVSVPYTLVVIDPSGRVLGTANSSSNGIASVNMPVSTSGQYVIQLVNVGVGPVNVWTAATPFVQR